MRHERLISTAPFDQLMMMMKMVDGGNLACLEAVRQEQRCAGKVLYLRSLRSSYTYPIRLPC